MSWMWIKSQLLRELFAEFLGTFTLIVLGDGAVAQSVLTGNALGNYFSVNVGYAMAVTFGVYVSAGVSGGHINPAVTLTMALFRRLKWIKVPVYMAGQYLGAFCGAAVVYGVYFDLLKAKGLEIPDTAGIFATYPYKDITNATALGDQIVGTAMLLMLVMAVTDKVAPMIRQTLNG
jgi:MIP family channel proteins